ncbi:peroxidase 5-like [Phoenix dactylifera]|uniref:Peroxidase n=1 Tax=Phoenix dactylifera TaxID=42345 RepID=A0A8B7CWR9_PHODC|nr:peroxidase 5-like [Phoenix dactylifera]
MAFGRRGEVLLAFAVALCLSATKLEAYELHMGYYGKTCPQAEFIVLDEVKKAVAGDAGLAADLVRMHFHDCFVRGCDGSILIDSTPNNMAEKDAPPNNPSLEGFEIIDNAKKRLEAECKGMVSCADIVAFAARDAVVLTGGLFYEVPAGRRDGRVSIANEALTNLPPPSFDLNQLTQSFAQKGLSQDEMIILSGAHTIGQSHCSSFSSRLYNFNSAFSQDPSLDPAYAAQLKQECPNTSSGANQEVPMDPKSPSTFDTSYYSNLLVNRGLFTSDQTLMSTPATAAKVWQNAADWLGFQKKFGQAMRKMGKIGVLTGSEGEIRCNCRVVNGFN